LTLLEESPSSTTADPFFVPDSLLMIKGGKKHPLGSFLSRLPEQNGKLYEHFRAITAEIE
jgi:hypothetical protein